MRIHGLAGRWTIDGYDDLSTPPRVGANPTPQRARLRL
jgi:hypothetical protein